MHFMFNRFLTLHVTDADRAQHIADHAKRLSSSEKAALDAELQAVPDDLPSWKLRDLETGVSSEYSFKPTELVVVEGTSTEESTWDAISKAVKDFNSRVGAGNKTDECVYLAFADHGAAFCVDGCVVFRSGTGDTRVIPMQLAVARDVSLADASEWVDGLRAKLASDAEVAAFCVVRPAQSETGPFRFNISTDTNIPSTKIKDGPIVIYNFDSSNVSVGVRSSLLALDSAFKLMIQKVCRGGENIVKLSNCYPAIR
jgi:hypothetical protein